MMTEKSTPKDAICKNCEYSLFNLQEQRCPECGEPFDPEDKNTFTIGSERRLERVGEREAAFMFAISFSALHFIVVLALCFLSGSTGATPLEKVAYFFSWLLLQPMLLLAKEEIRINLMFPFQLPFLLNSLLWGFVGAFLVTRIQRRRSRKRDALISESNSSSD